MNYYLTTAEQTRQQHAELVQEAQADHRAAALQRERRFRAAYRSTATSGHAIFRRRRSAYS